MEPDRPTAAIEALLGDRDHLDAQYARFAADVTAQYKRFARRMLTAVVIIALAAAGAVTAAGVAINQAKQESKDRATAIAGQAHADTQSNVSARYADCIEGDEVRSALYAQAAQSETTTPLLLRLVPALNTPEIRRLIAANTSAQLKAFAPRGMKVCTAKALSSVPARQRSRYSVP